jgi:hypothetical protein
MRRTILAALALISLGCSSTSPRVPVSGDASDIAKLAGEWSGDYWGATNGRSGAISFHLEAGSDSARGSVTMIQRPLTFAPGPGASPETHGLVVANTISRALNLTFVRAENGKVRGRLDPYTDPACDCTAFTSFEGVLHRNKIEGTFQISHGAGGETATGNWKVRRKKT